MFSFEFSRQRIVSFGIAALVATALLPSPAVWAQNGESQVAPPGGEVPPMQGGDSPSAPSRPGYHILRAKTEAGKHAAPNGPATQFKTQAAASIKPLAATNPKFYPADLSFFGGFVITQRDSLNIYYNCADSSCFGNPEQFQTDLAKSKFIHVVDQYVHSKANNRYPLSKTPPVHLNGGTGTFDSSGIEDLVTQAATQAGTGHIFHVFLPQGVDVCLGPGVCYSPDNFSTFVFCGYHSFVNIGGVDVFYTVEPYEDVLGCRLAPPNPNSALIDSTNSVLSHELFETISDPYPGNNPAWLADSSLLEEGNEIGDICQGPSDGFGQAVAQPYLLVKGRIYQTQLEYSNARHACVLNP